MMNMEAAKEVKLGTLQIEDYQNKEATGWPYAKSRLDFSLNEDKFYVEFRHYSDPNADMRKPDIESKREVKYSDIVEAFADNYTGEKTVEDVFKAFTGDDIAENIAGSRSLSLSVEDIQLHKDIQEYIERQVFILGQITEYSEYFAGGDLAKRGNQTKYTAENGKYYATRTHFDDYAEVDYKPEKMEVTYSDIVNAFAEAMQSEAEYEDVYTGNYDAITSHDIDYSIKLEQLQKDALAIAEAEQKRTAAMETDITTMIIGNQLEDAMFEIGSELAPHPTANFVVPMYDEGLQNLVDRTNLLDSSSDYNTVKDVINSDDSSLTVYLDVDKAEGVCLTITLDYEAPVQVPLTGEEIDKFVALANSTLEKEGGVTKFIEDTMKELQIEESAPDMGEPEPPFGNASKTINSEKIEGLTVEMFEDGSGSASLNGKKFVQFDLATGETNFEDKGWEKWGTKTTETLMRFAETYALENLDAKEIEDPVKWFNEVKSVDDRTNDDDTAKHFTLEVGEDSSAVFDTDAPYKGASIFVDISAYLNENGEIIIDFDDTSKGYTLDSGMHETFYDLPEAVVDMVRDKALELATEAIALDIIKQEVADHPNGYDRYFDYRDQIEASTIAEIFHEYQEESFGASDYPNFEAFLTQKIYEKWDMDFSDIEIIEDGFKSNHTDAEMAIVDAYLEANDMHLEEALYDNGFAGVQWDVKDIVGDYKLNIMLTTPTEQKYDMGSIPDMFGVEGVEKLNQMLTKMSENEREKHFDNALTYLVYQQGHSLTELTEAYFSDTPSDNTFVKSVVDELNDFPQYGMAELTVLVKLNKDGLEALDRIAKGEGDVTFSKNTMLGLYNEWQGAGALLDIQLEQNFTVPASMVRNVQIEGQRSDYTHGYTVDDTYGLIGSCWKDTMSKAETPANGVEITAAYQADLPKVIEVIKEAAKPEPDKTKKNTDDFGNR